MNNSDDRGPMACVNERLDSAIDEATHCSGWSGQHFVLGQYPASRIIR